MIPQKSIAHYRITAKLGEGGMGEVWRATDTKLGREVAIKILPPVFADDVDRLARFEREAQVLASLNHPNIAAIYGIEHHALVMELVDGPTLVERMAQGPLPLDEVLSIAKQIGEALDAAHEKGIVHRDLKPANVKLTPDGRVKVLDFGLAKAMTGDTASADPANSPTLTMSSTRMGVILGTARYMAPEQARGKAVDCRVDIWAFGVVLYEMLTGKAMFEGETVSDILAAVLQGDIDLMCLPPGTPPKVRHLLQWCLERDPKRRLRDIGDAWVEFDGAAPPAPAPPRSRLSWIVPAAVLMGIAGVAWGIFYKPAPPPGPVRRWSYSVPFAFPALSRDGSRLVFSEATNDLGSLWVRMMDRLEAKPLAGTDNSYDAAFSPDGQWVAFLSFLNGPKIKKIPATGGTAITVSDVPGAPRTITWGDDGNIVVGSRKGLMRVSAAGGTPEALTTVDPKLNERGHYWPEILPGGQAVLFTVQTGASFQVAVLDLKKRTTRVLVRNGAGARYARTGHLIYFRSATLFAAPFNLARLEIAGAETPVVEGVAEALAGGGCYALSDSGLLVYRSGGEGRSVLAWADRKGTTETISEPTAWGTGRLSPVHSRIADTITAAGKEDIWIYDSNGRTPTQLTFDGQSSDPIWSPDERWITYAGVQGGKYGIYRILADGSGKPELLLETRSAAQPDSWSPDGKTLVYSEEGPNTYHLLWSVSLPGGKPVRIHESATGEGFGEVSPDGRWLAYLTYEDGNVEIYVSPFPGPGGRTRIGASVGEPPRWSRDGKELLFWSGGDAARQLMAVDVQLGPVFRSGIPKPLFKLRSGSTWDVAPDGNRFLVELSSKTSLSPMLGVENWFEELQRLSPVKR